MNRVTSMALAAGVGAGIGLGAYAFTDVVLESNAERNKVVESCTKHLGETALETTVLPEPCQRFELDFDRRTVTVVGNAENGNTQVTGKERIFTLPPADEFRHDNTSSEKGDVNLERFRMAFGSVMGLFITWAVYSELTFPQHLERHREQLRKDLEAQFSKPR